MVISCDCRPLYDLGWPIRLHQRVPDRLGINFLPEYDVND